ncbi:hypothetical protein [Cumulibacter manganitolerans]|uniref:hypothetical protein n=1 Tax=Cumulibacter manganitolerans TaxID=1884992 RepID=UPI00129547FD|nr:hypothetical protein [Cumulibacter manganitolerans]
MRIDTRHAEAHLTHLEVLEGVALALLRRGVMLAVVLQRQPGGQVDQVDLPVATERPERRVHQKCLGGYVEHRAHPGTQYGLRHRPRTRGGELDRLAQHRMTPPTRPVLDERVQPVELHRAGAERAPEGVEQRYRSGQVPAEAHEVVRRTSRRRDRDPVHDLDLVVLDVHPEDGEAGRGTVVLAGEAHLDRRAGRAQHGGPGVAYAVDQRRGPARHDRSRRRQGSDERRDRTRGVDCAGQGEDILHDRHEAPVGEHPIAGTGRSPLRAGGYAAGNGQLGGIEGIITHASQRRTVVRAPARRPQPQNSAVE